MTIWKYDLAITDEQFIEVPKVNRPLAVQVQGSMPKLWMLVQPDSPRIRVKVRVFGTGHTGVESEMDYVGTFQVEGGALVFHVFLSGWSEIR